MKITDMAKKDFANVKRREWNDDVGEFDELVIIPGGANDIHDSGYRNITYCLCINNEPICLTSGGSDVIHIDGIGGYGKDWLEKYGKVPSTIPPVAWNLDCLPKSGYLRLWATNYKLVCGSDVSSFEVYASKKRKGA